MSDNKILDPNSLNTLIKTIDSNSFADQVKIIAESHEELRSLLKDSYNIGYVSGKSNSLIKHGGYESTEDAYRAGMLHGLQCRGDAELDGKGKLLNSFIIELAEALEESNLCLGFSSDDGLIARAYKITKKHK